MKIKATIEFDSDYTDQPAAHLVAAEATRYGYTDARIVDWQVILPDVRDLLIDAGIPWVEAGADEPDYDLVVIGEEESDGHGVVFVKTEATGFAFAAVTDAVKAAIDAGGYTTRYGTHNVWIHYWPEFPGGNDDDEFDIDDEAEIEIVFGPDGHCPACGEWVSYCEGHGSIGDPVGARILDAHDNGYHGSCHPLGCDEAREEHYARTEGE